MKRTNLLALILLLLLCTVSQGAFQFVAWSDNRPYDSANEARFVWMLQQMNLIVGSEPLFHVVPGDYDLTSITAADIEAESLIKTWYRAPGNHDTADLGWPNSTIDLPETDPQARFIFWNQYQCPDGVCDCSMGRVCSHALTWLGIECQSATEGFPIFVVGHEPAFPENRHVGDSLDFDLDERDDFWALLEQYKATYICGHTHYYSTYPDPAYPGDEATQIDVGNAGALGEPHQTFVVFEVDGSNVSFTVHTTEYDVSVPPQASNPNPENDAKNVPVDTVLSWIAGINAVSHNVHFGITDTPPSIQNQTETIYDPGTLEYETTYYWRIDEVGTGDPVTGEVWSFTTVSTLPWSDDFESGSFADGGWTTSGNASVSSKADYSSNYGAEIKGTSWIEKAVSTVGFSNINIKYVCKTKGLDDGEYLYVEWHDGSDGSPWNLLEDIQSTSWSHQNLPCEGANDNAAFKVRFRTNASNSAEYAYVDDVEIYESTVVTPPGPASNPSPGNDAVDVAVDVDLSWTAGAGAESHDVYLGTDTSSLLLKSKGQSTTTYDPGTLVNNTTYYWRIDEENAYGITTGIVWNFTTQSAGGTMHVGSIVIGLSTKTAGPNTFTKARATVTIIDVAGDPVEGATVYGSWSGATSDTDSGLTDGGGIVTLESDQVKNAPVGTTFTFTVDSVVKSGWTYDSSAGETSGSIPVP